VKVCLSKGSKVMTKEELLAKLRDSNGNYDPESDHCDAEDWLLEFVNDREIEQAWAERRRKNDWWYA